MILRLYRKTYFLPSFFFGIIRYFTHKYAPYHKHNGEKDTWFRGCLFKNPLVAEVHTQILDKFIYMCILMYLEIPGILNRKLAIGWPCFHPSTDPDCIDCYENMDSSG